MFPGVAHLEALEELSRWSAETLNKHLSGLSGKSADTVHDDLALVNESFHLEDLDDVMDGLYCLLSTGVPCRKIAAVEGGGS